MDFFKEQQAKLDSNAVKIGQLAYEKHRILQQIDTLNKQIKGIDAAISDLEVSSISAQQAQRDFNSYLAIREGAVTLDEIKEGIQNGGK